MTVGLGFKKTKCNYSLSTFTVFIIWLYTAVNGADRKQLMTV